jgi:hypothetical protein
MICILKIPANLPGRPDWILSLECRVRVIRVEPAQENGIYGIGFEIEDYRFIHI